MNRFPSSKLFKRYLDGECEAVYEFIASLGEEAFSSEYFPDIELVLTETFRRASFNIDVIYHELIVLKYAFWKDESGNDQARLKPGNSTGKIMTEIEKSLLPFAHIPLSLKKFYEIAGSCDFSWNYEANEKILWEGADPMQIIPASQLLLDVTDEDWIEQAFESLTDPNYGYTTIDLSADSLHKDNVSGGPAYGIRLTTLRSIDSKFLNEPNDTQFVNYLRICFNYCGFPGMAGVTTNKNFNSFLENVRPQLKSL